MTAAASVRVALSTGHEPPVPLATLEFHGAGLFDRAMPSRETQIAEATQYACIDRNIGTIVKRAVSLHPPTTNGQFIIRILDVINTDVDRNLISVMSVRVFTFGEKRSLRWKTPSRPAIDPAGNAGKANSPASFRFFLRSADVSTSST